MQLVTSDVRSSIRNMTDYRVNGADGPDHCQRWRKGRRRTSEKIKSLWSEGNHGSVIRDRKTERQPEVSSERCWRRETKRRWMVRKQNNMVVATVGFCFHRGHDRSLKSWVGFILTSSPSSSLCRLCRTSSFAAINMTREEYCRLAEVGFGWFRLCTHSVYWIITSNRVMEMHDQVYLNVCSPWI